MVQSNWHPKASRTDPCHILQSHYSFKTVLNATLYAGPGVLYRWFLQEGDKAIALG